MLNREIIGTGDIAKIFAQDILVAFGSSLYSVLSRDHEVRFKNQAHQNFKKIKSTRVCISRWHIVALLAVYRVWSKKCDAQNFGLSIRRLES